MSPPSTVNQQVNLWLHILMRENQTQYSLSSLNYTSNFFTNFMDTSACITHSTVISVNFNITIKEIEKITVVDQEK